MVKQAQLAEAVGFDGATVAEHHGGFPGYMPQPLLAASWALAETDTISVAPCPVILSTRNPLHVAEQVAWLSARFPGRIGLGLAAGYAQEDLAPFGRPQDGIGRLYLDSLQRFVAIFEGRTEADADIAIRDFEQVPMVSASNTPLGIREATALGLGIAVVGSADDSAQQRGLLELCRRHALGKPIVYTRRVWLGAVDAGRLEELEAAYASWRRVSATGGDVLVGTAETAAAQLVAELAALEGPSLNVRFHIPHATSKEIAAQIERFAAEVLPAVRQAHPLVAPEQQGRPGPGQLRADKTSRE
jgi:alkanesulfonate monooxygenase SsuD/methylene tetrahydromethanopterin reductase-like flavin-dependent oxidoreductase (luciferase family)